MRILSLLASGTEIVCALGAGEELVGRSHECDNPAWVRTLPACSRPAFDIAVSSREIDAEVRRRMRAGEPLYLLDAELIGRLAPDVILAQEHCEVCAVTPADVGRSGCGVGLARVLALNASSVGGIFESIRQVGQAIGREDAADKVIRCETARLERVRQSCTGRKRPTVTLLEWTDPVFAMGNWAPELVDMAHGEPLLGAAGIHSVAGPFQQLRQADPEYLVVAPCGFTLERAWKDRLVLEQEDGWRDLRAVRAGTVAFADGNLFFNRSGMTIAATAEILAEILHGVVLDRPAENVHWRWYRPR